MTRLPEGVDTSCHTVRVAYADTDQGGIVHHASYVRYLEQARIEHMRARGLPYAKLEREDGLALPVVEAHLRYRQPARFDDVLEVVTWIGLINRAKLRFDSHVRRNGDLLTEAQITLVCMRLDTGRITSLPKAVWDVCAAS